MSEKSRQRPSPLDIDAVCAAFLLGTLLDSTASPEDAGGNPAIAASVNEAVAVAPALLVLAPPLSPSEAVAARESVFRAAAPLPLDAFSCTSPSPADPLTAGSAIVSLVEPQAGFDVIGSNAAIVFSSLASAIVATNVASASVASARSGSSGASAGFTYKGVNYVADIYGSLVNGDTLSRLAADHLNAVAITVDFGIDAVHNAVYDNDVDGGYTESDDHISNTIQEAAALGLKVMYRPLIDFIPGVDDTSNSLNGSYYDDEWRTYYNPGAAGSAGADSFFASYQAMIVSQAKLAQDAGATMFSIGLELDQVTGPSYKSYWDNVITAVRQVFSGQLVYGADWNDSDSPWRYGGSGLPAGTGNILTQVSFWSELDYIGIDEYAPISDAADPSLSDLIKGWTQTPTDQTTLSITGEQSLMSYYEGLAASVGRPMLFTEIGYANSSDAASSPATPGYGTDGNPDNATTDATLSANLYTAFIDAWTQYGDGSLAGAYVWNWEPSGAGQSPFNVEGLAAETALRNGFVSTPAYKASVDFNGDGVSDIFWRNANGDDEVWLTKGSGGFSFYDDGNVSTDWQVAATGDLNGDGKADVLWRNVSSGDAYLYTSNSSGAFDYHDLGAVPLSWRLAEVADFNGDGLSDILWRNANGDDEIWRTKAGGGFDYQNIGGVATNWDIVGVGDFSGDRDADILWRDASGDTETWLTQASGGYTYVNDGTVSSDWQVAGVGDFNGDGKADILWRNSSSGDAYLYQSNKSGGFGYFDLGVVGTDWRIAKVGDFNGDGLSDILWRSTSGDTEIWETKAGGGFKYVGAGNAPTSWQPVG